MYGARVGASSASMDGAGDRTTGAVVVGVSASKISMRSWRFMSVSAARVWVLGSTGQLV